MCIQILSRGMYPNNLGSNYEAYIVLLTKQILTLIARSCANKDCLPDNITSPSNSSTFSSFSSLSILILSKCIALNTIGLPSSTFVSFVEKHLSPGKPSDSPSICSCSRIFNNSDSSPSLSESVSESLPPFSVS